MALDLDLIVRILAVVLALVLARGKVGEMTAMRLVSIFSLLLLAWRS